MLMIVGLWEMRCMAPLCRSRHKVCAGSQGADETAALGATAISALFLFPWMIVTLKQSLYHEGAEESHFLNHGGPAAGTFLLITGDALLMGNRVSTFRAEAISALTGAGSAHSAGASLSASHSSAGASLSASHSSAGACALSHRTGSISSWHFVILLLRPVTAIRL